MATTAQLTVKDKDPLGTVQDFLSMLLAQGEVAAVFVPRHMPGGGPVMPSLVTDTAELATADPFAPSFPLNAARLVARLSRGETDGTVAAVLRPCEIRAFVELVKLNQGSVENLLIIGADCAGAFANAEYTRFVGDRDPVAASRDFAATALKTQWEGEPKLAKACMACEHPSPEGADIIIGGFGVDRESWLPLMAKTPRGEGLLSRLEVPDSEAASGRDEALRAVVDRAEAFRDAMFEETRGQVSSIAGLAQYLSGCVGCYNCRVACPVCYCRECVFVTDVFDHDPWQYMDWARQKGALKMPTDTVFFHLTRLAHMSTACVGCGQCSNACPNDIPVMELFRSAAQKTQAAFDYEAGRDPNEPPPLAVFQEKEFSAMTGGTD
ncbi:Coenzyme F420 hydrogenase/dehydrogenase, beta subunit C-terminal domain [Desulfobaculum sp.]